MEAVMKKYLDPKTDLTFKKVFGEHKDLVISFMNALLPFDSPEEEIEDVEYLSPELVPVNPLWKDSVVDVRCRDVRGRQFIVEMQMMWTVEYKQRVLFNAYKAYVSQLHKGEEFHLLQPVYSLNMLNDTYSDSESYYHDYKIVEVAETKEVIDGLRFIFIELPKFTPKSYCEKKMQTLWLRYLTEIDEKTEEAPKELLENPQISKAMEELEESAFSQSELYIYDRFWDMVSTSRTLINSALRRGKMQGEMIGEERGLKRGMRKGMRKGMEEGLKKGMAEGLEKGMEKGMEKGLEKGKEDERRKNAVGMKAEGIPVDVISRVTGLTPEEVSVL